MPVKEAKLTASGVTQVLPGCNPITIMATISDEVQTLSGGKYLQSLRIELEREWRADW